MVFLLCFFFLNCILFGFFLFFNSQQFADYCSRHSSLISSFKYISSEKYKLFGLVALLPGSRIGKCSQSMPQVPNLPAGVTRAWCTPPCSLSSVRNASQLFRRLPMVSSHLSGVITDFLPATNLSFGRGSCLADKTMQSSRF